MLIGQASSEANSPLRTPPRPCRLEVDVSGLSPLKGLNLDLDFEQFEQFHMSD